MISLKEVREYYGKMTGLLNFMNLIFMTVISGLGIYIADIMSDSDESETKIYALYTVFVVGIVLMLLLFIASLMGKRGEYEAAIRIRRVLSVLSFIVGIISLYVSLSEVVSKYDEFEDSYTAAIFAIQLSVSILVIVTSVLIFMFAFNGNKYFDNKKPAKDIPEGMTAEKNTRKYTAFIGIAYYIISISAFLLSCYFASEIDYFSGFDLSDNSAYSSVFNTIYLIGTITSVLVFITAVCMLFLKGKFMYIADRISYVLNTLAQLFFIIYSFTIIPKDFVKSSHPDTAYIIFALVLVVISITLAIRAELQVRKITRANG